MIVYKLIITRPETGTPYAELFAPNGGYVSGKRLTADTPIIDWDEWVSKVTRRTVTRVSDASDRNSYGEFQRAITYEVQPRFTVFPASIGKGWLIWDRQVMVNGTKGDFVRLGSHAAFYAERADAETIVKELNDFQENMPSGFEECHLCDQLVLIADREFHLECECGGEPTASNAGSAS